MSNFILNALDKIYPGVKYVLKGASVDADARELVKMVNIGKTKLSAVTYLANDANRKFVPRRERKVAKKALKYLEGNK